MKLADFLGKYSDAKSARNTALEKVKAALEELSSAENELDNTMSLLSEGSLEYEYTDLSVWDDSLLDELMKPAKIMDSLFGGTFGDLF